MQYQDFKTKIITSDFNYFNLDKVIEKSTDELTVRCAKLIKKYSFLPPGMLVEYLDDMDVLATDMKFFNVSKDPHRLEGEELQKYNTDLFELRTLAQVFKAGEGCVEIVHNLRQSKFLVQCLEMFIKSEKLSRSGFGRAYRENYSFFCLDKPIFLGGAPDAMQPS